MVLSDSIKLQNLIPGVYTSESRDFQILCRACDVLANGVKYDIDSIIEILNTSEIRNTLLPLLKTKLGFLSNVHLTDFELRLILQAIPYIRKCKGSRKALFYAVNTYAKVHKLTSPITIIVHNKVTTNLTIPESWLNGGREQASEVAHMGEVIDEEDDDEPVVPVEPVNLSLYTNEYTVRIGMKSAFEDLYILDELLKYALPFGYKLQYYYYDDIKHITGMFYADRVSYRPRSKHITDADQIGRFEGASDTPTPIKGKLIFKGDGDISDLYFIPPKPQYDQPFDFEMDENGEFSYKEIEPFAIVDDYEMYMDDNGNLIYVTHDINDDTPDDDESEEENEGEEES